MCFSTAILRCFGPDGQPASITVVFSLNSTKEEEKQGAEATCKSDYNGWPEVRTRQGFEKAEARVENS